MRTAALKLRPEPAHPHGQQTRKLGLGEFLADAAPRAVQEGHEAVIALGAPAIVRLARLFHPALRTEFFRVRTPLFDGAVVGPGREDDDAALGDELRADRSVVRRDAERHGDWGPESEHFGAHGVEEVALVDVCG